MAEDDNNSSPLFTANVSVILIALGSAAFVVTMYHLIALCLCRHHLTNSDEPPINNNELHLQASSSYMDENSLAELIPSHKYTKKKRDDDGDVEGGGEATCAVCLGDFEEGEEVRTLPECWHSFHVSCIDKWLLSHPNCPVCRAVATPSPSPVVMSTVSEAVASGDLALVAVDHRVDNIVAQNALVHSFMLRR